MMCAAGAPPRINLRLEPPRSDTDVGGAQVPRLDTSASA